ncbi:TPA: colibactin self-protection protein ClbS, partial [Escherichia coli]
LIERFSNDELYGKPWYNKWTRGRMIQFNTASPYKNASGRLNKLQKCLAE